MDRRSRYTYLQYRRSICNATVCFIFIEQFMAFSALIIYGAGCAMQVSGRCLKMVQCVMTPKISSLPVLERKLTIVEKKKEWSGGPF